MSPTANESDIIKQDISIHRENVVALELESAKQVFGGSRSDVDEQITNILSVSGVRSTPFNRRKRFQFAASGAPSALVDLTLEASKSKPIPFGETQQPSGEALGIQAISIELAPDMKLNTYKVLQKIGVRVIRQDGEVGMEFPLADLMDTGIYVADAGNNAGAVVAGTHHSLGNLRAVPLAGRQGLLILPGDRQSGIEFFKRPEFSASDFVLTGETADLYFDVCWKGIRVAKAKGAA